MAKKQNIYRHSIENRMEVLKASFVKEGILNKEGLNYLGIEINVPKIEKKDNLQKKNNLFVFVIDNSGSMASSAGELPLNHNNIHNPNNNYGLLSSHSYSNNIYGGNYYGYEHSHRDYINSRIYYAKEAVKTFINSLDENDKIAVVTFNSIASVIQEMSLAKTKSDIIPNIDRITVDGCTNMGEGLNLARELISKSDIDSYNCKIILLSDGEVNGGLNERQLVELSKDFISQGITLTSLGIGTDYNSKLMNDIATGLFYHVDKLSLLDNILSEELKLTNEVAYNNAKLILKYNGLVEVSTNLNEIIEKNKEDCKVLTLGSLISNTSKKIVFELKNDLEKEKCDFDIILELEKDEKILIHKSIKVYSDKKELDKLTNNDKLMEYIINVLRQKTLQDNTLSYMKNKNMRSVNLGIQNLENTYDTILDKFNYSDNSYISNTVSESVSHSHCVSQSYSISNDNDLKGMYSSNSVKNFTNK